MAWLIEVFSSNTSKRQIMKLCNVSFVWYRKWFEALLHLCVVFSNSFANDFEKNKTEVKQSFVPLAIPNKLNIAKFHNSSLMVLV